MGSGYKDFAPGDVLAAADVDGYLMRQTVMTFADAAARNAALSGVLDEGMAAYLEDTNIVTFYNGSAWLEMTLSSQTWTPSWTNLTVGNGTLTGNYQRTGDLVTFQVKLVFGSTTSISGNVEVSLPVTAADAHEAAAGVVGNLYFVSSGTNIYYVWGDVDTTSNILLTTGSTSQRKGQEITATFPVTWATTDIWAITGSYRAA